jgi:hypothetical protein
MLTAQKVTGWLRSTDAVARGKRVTAKFRHAALLVVVLALIGAGGTLARGQIDRARAQGEAVCSWAALSGRYAYHTRGVVFIGPSGVPDPGGVRSDVVAVGVLTLDGQGGFTAVEVSGRGQQRLQRTFAGSYDVRPDCFGVARVRGIEATVEEINFAVAARGTKIILLGTTPVSSFTGEATRQ